MAKKLDKARHVHEITLLEKGHLPETNKIGMKFKAKNKIIIS